MSKIYLPKKIVLGQEEVDLEEYKNRQNFSFCVAFTLNQSTQMYTGNRYTDSLDASLTAVSWIEDNYCPLEIIGNYLPYPKFERIIKTCTFYLDRGGNIVSGNIHEVKYSAQTQKRSETSANDDTIDKLVSVFHNFNRPFVSGSNNNTLHKEIFINRVFRIEGMDELQININSEFYKLLQTVSIYNRSMDMSFVYSVAQNKKEQLEKFKKIVNIVSLPFGIQKYAWLKALQESISLINYLCTIDDVMNISDKLFEFRGPLVISDLLISNYLNGKQDGRIDNESSEYFKNKALNEFLNIETTLGNEIKTIKEPII